ncbi:TonB-dependent receptor domain-containing protein [Thalassotalea fusca]
MISYRQIKHVILGIFLWFTLSCAHANELTKFEIPALTADQSLLLLAQQSNKTLFFSPAQLINIKTQPVVGYYTFGFALRKLLRETGLIVTVSHDNHVTIAPSLPQTLASSNKITVKTHETNVAANTTAETLVEKIAIIGRSSSVRSLTDLSVPVDILEANMLKRTGQAELGKMLQSIAPSFNFSSSVISDGTDVLRPATLRGLGPDQTLILVNGKRRHQASLIHINTSVGRGTAGADINTIPIDAIKHIEILRDGAAAQYGSDAIAGVINIVLHSNDDTAHLTSMLGKYDKGDGESVELSFNQGMSLFDKGFINFTLEIEEQNATNRSGLHGSCQYNTCQAVSDDVYQTTDPREISANRHTFKIGQPEYRQYASVINTEYPLGSVNLYGFLIASQRDNESAAFFRHHGHLEANPQLADGDALIPAGYLPHIETSITDGSINIGLRSDNQSDYWYDLSYTYGENAIDYRTINSVNPSYANWLSIQNKLSPEDIRRNIPRNADAYGLNLSLSTLNLDARYHFENVSLSFGAEFRQDRYQITPGEQYSYYDYDTDISAGTTTEDSLGGIQGFPGISPDSAVDERRNVRSFYLEAESEIIENLYATSAVRFDDYDGFDNTYSIKLAANWSITNDIAIRSALNTGFRAPSMQQLYFNNTSTQFLVNEAQRLSPQQVGTYRNDSSIAKLIGIPTLTEEESDNLSVGVVYTPYENFMMSVDYYQIDIDNRIVLSNKINADASPELQQIFADESIDKAQFFLNGVNTTTEGIDIVATWFTALANGQLDITFAANYTNTKVTDVFSPQNSILASLPQEQVFAQQDLSIIEAWQPDSRHNLNIEYVQQNWLLNLAFNRYGSYTITDGDTQTYTPKLLTDLRFEYQLNDRWLFFTGSNNVFNVTPDRNRIGNSHAGTVIDDEGNVIVQSDGVFKYSRRSAPFGFNGRYLYAGLTYQF